MKKFFFLVILSTFSFNGSFSQSCLKGDCKNGFGVQRFTNNNKNEYKAGNFKKGKLDGQGCYIQWGASSIDSEVDFLLYLSQQNPDMHILWSFKPSFIQAGNFINGNIEGKGVMVMNDYKYWPSHEWLASYKFPVKDLKSMKYEGDFINGQPAKKGIVTCTYNGDTLIFASDELGGSKGRYGLSEFELVIDVRNKLAEKNELIMGDFVNRKLHGWAVAFKGLGKQAKFYRQLWCYGNLEFEDEGGAYPFDMDDSKLIKTVGGQEITGPVKEGKVNGFGKISYPGNRQYTGYIKDNAPDGYGLMESNGLEKYGVFNGGYFVLGIWLTIMDMKVIVEKGRHDNFKEGIIESNTYRSLADYIKGNKPYEGFVAYTIDGVGWQGKVTSFDTYSKRELLIDKGVIISSSADVNNISLYQVYVKDGIASVMTQYAPGSGQGTLSDGRGINSRNKHEFKLSNKYFVSHFYDVCPCGGDGKSSVTAEVQGYTSSWTRTEQVNKSAVVGYWAGTQQVTSTYYTPGYTITRKVACANPDAVWAPFGTTTRHSVLKIKSLNE